MLYCVFFESGTTSFDRDWEYIAIDEVLLDKIVENYLRGISEFRHVGVTYNLAEYYFQIYRLNDEYDAEKIRNTFYEHAQENKKIGGTGEELIQGIGVNVTGEFLKGREWSDLKEDLFNVYINANGKKRVRTTIEKADLQKFIESWHKGENSAWLDGSRIDLIEPSTFQIYDINIKYRR
jgi:hypothetical protein